MRRGCFGWEYKGKHKDLDAAYRQLSLYREGLENPPLLVVCDLNRFEIHTNFTGTVKRVYAFDLADLAANRPTTHGLTPLQVLRALFIEPDTLRPGRTIEEATEQAAAEFAKLAAGLHRRGADPEQAARFLMRLLFCLFAEDIGLLPAGLFSRLVQQTRRDLPAFRAQVGQLFATMRAGGWFGTDRIAHFNGGLFDDDTTVELDGDDLNLLNSAAVLDWASIEPAVFGTLFERSLDPAKRSQLGAHYTSRADILLIVEPVLMAPLRRRWAQVKAEAAGLIARWEASSVLVDGTSAAHGRQTATINELRALLDGFLVELAAIQVLDPACGSGNFLYVALKQLLDLEKEVITVAIQAHLTDFTPRVSPTQLHGIEIDSYAHELAGVAIWIGYIQWLNDNGFGVPSDPILKPLHAIQHMDAILTHDDQGRPAEPEWPAAEVIIGNPPFLGDKKMRTQLGRAYVDDLRRLYEGRVPGGADLVCYWFEKARAQIEAKQAERAGLLATNSITGGINRRVLDRIKATGDIFLGWNDRPWVLEGASVRVAMVGFDNGADRDRSLNGTRVARIGPDLRGDLELTLARRLPENVGLAYIGDTKKGAFDIDANQARRLLAAPLNPNGRPNSDVVVPWVNGLDVTRRPRDMWIIDFGIATPEADAALYEAPFEHVRRHVKPERDQVRNALERSHWWLHARPAPDCRAAVRRLPRFIATPTLSKYRLFVWLQYPTLPDHQLVVITRADDYFLGVLHSRAHELWGLRLGTSLEDRPRYTPSTTFETFPFPWPPGQEPVADPRVEAIAQAAREVVQRRDAWLNPPGASEAELKKRTLTNLYNQRPTWLGLAHAALDRAVLAAYGWPPDLSDDDLLARLLALNLARASGAGGVGPPAASGE